MNFHWGWKLNQVRPTVDSVSRKPLVLQRKKLAGYSQLCELSFDKKFATNIRWCHSATWRIYGGRVQWLGIMKKKLQRVLDDNEVNRFGYRWTSYVVKFSELRHARTPNKIRCYTTHPTSLYLTRHKPIKRDYGSEFPIWLRWTLF